MQRCLNATFHVERYSVREQATDSRGECCLPVPRESVACSRTLYLSTWSVAFKHVCMPMAATSSTSFDSIIHPMDQGKSTFNYMSIGWLFRKIFRKKRGLWRVRHPVLERTT